MIVLKNVLPAYAGSTILKIDTKHFSETSHIIGVETTQIESEFVMCFGFVALSFAHFPFYPLLAPQAGP